MRGFIFWSLVSLGLAVSSAPARGEEALPSQSGAGWDVKVGASARAVPFGMSLNGEAGRGILLWGAGPIRKGEFLYGYVRPGARLRTSGFTTRAEAFVQLYPVSILGVEAGGGYGHRFTRSLATQDCAVLECGGGLTSLFLRAELKLGVGDFFGVILGGLNRLTSTRSGRSFADEFSALSGLDGGDTLKDLTALSGYRFSDRWSGGAVVAAGEMSGSGSWNNLEAVFARWEREDRWTITAGVGAYRSRTAELGPTGFLLVSRELSAGLEPR